MKKVANKDSWKRLSLPDKRAPLEFNAVYTDLDGEKLHLGLVPVQMEDKWFIYFEDGWLYFHRSWTGACIYWVKLDGCPTGVRISDSWVNRDDAQYKEDDTEYDRKVVCFLIDALLLGKQATFPRPTNVAEPMPGIYQHHIVGRAYPEAAHKSEKKG